MKLAQHAEKYVQFYAHRHRIGLGKTKERIVREHLRHIKGFNVLDVGCGDGFFSNICQEKGANTVSIDVFKSMISYAYKSNRNLFAINGSGQNIPVASDIIDLVLALDVIEHMQKPLPLLKEIYRVLKQKGGLLLTTDNSRVLPTYLFLRLYRWITRNCLHIYPQHPKLPCVRVTPHVREYSTDETIVMLEHAGFGILEYDTYSEAPFFQLIDSVISFVLRGPLRKYKYPKQFMFCMKRV